MQQMEAEIRGDWSNIRGTEYHFVYALWRIIADHSPAVWFYKGNDLLASSEIETLAPPVFDEELADDLVPSVPLRGGTAEIDEWIQLKATRKPWTPSEVLKDNLLFNFICNAYYSESQGRQWSVSLISQGEVRSKKLIDFVSDPSKTPELEKLLEEILTKSKKHLKEIGWKNTKRSREKLSDVVTTIFKQIAAADRVPIDLLKKGIETELAYAINDRHTVESTARQLLGAMLLDSGKGPWDAHPYDVEWVNRAAGTPILDRGLLDRDVVETCNSSIARHSSAVRYENGLFAARQDAASSFERFLKSESPLFVLLGTSGTGKSWLAFHAAQELLRDHVRLFVSGDGLTTSPSLAGLVANELQPYTTATWQNDQFLKRFTSSALGKELAPILVVDDVGVSSDPDRLRQDLANLLDDCKKNGTRLVLTCQKQIWEFSHLGAEIDEQDIFAESRLESFTPYESASKPPENEQNENNESQSSSPENVTAPPKPGKHSYVLADFSSDEMATAVRLILPGREGEMIADKLRTPAFISLRRPFFLAQYLKRNRDSGLLLSRLPVADIDAMLDQTVDRVIQKAAIHTRLSESDIVPVLNSLIDELWKSRHRALTYSEVLKLLERDVGTKAAGLIETWRTNGFLTADGGVRVLDPLLADRIFAGRFAKHLREFEKEDLEELNPRLDFGIVVAYLRQADDPVSVSELLLAKDESWTSAVVAGLGQVKIVDWRILALLSALLARNKYKEMSREVYEIFGQLASRSTDAFRYLAEMYLGENGASARDGALGAISLTEYDPRSAEKLIRTRLRRLVTIEREFHDRDKRRKVVLDDALTPLGNINHVSAAETGKRLLKRYGKIAGSDKEEHQHGRREWDFVEALDDTRGRVALFDSEEFDRLLTDVIDPNPVVRFRSTQALISIAKERTSTVTPVLCDRIAKEESGSTLKRLLVAAYQLIAYAPLDLLDALQKSKIARLSERHRVTDGLTFELLGNLAEKHGAAVEEILPISLDRPNQDLIALSGEMFTYAWWRVIESTNGGSDHRALNAMEALDLTLESEELYGLVIRTRVVALLAKICIDLKISAAPLSGQQRFYSGLDRQFLYVHLSEFFETNLPAISSHSLFDQVTDLLFECVRKSDPVDVYPLSGVRDAVFRCGANCLRMLTSIAAASPNPAAILEKLPAGWQAIRAATELLEIGRTDLEVVEFSKSVLEAQKGTTTVQADAEGRELRARLGLLEGDPTQVIKDQRDAARRMPFGGMRNTEALIFTTRREPQKFLEFLESALIEVEDIATLYELVATVETWESVLISRIYARMLNDKEIDPDEARALCRQMLQAADAMEESPIKLEYLSIYGAILQILDGFMPSALTQSLDADTGKTVISLSHSQAIAIINEILAAVPEERTKEWLDEIKHREKWWHESSRFEFRERGLAYGSGLSGIYFFPAVRLAFLAAGYVADVRDPAAQIMARRREIDALLKEGIRLLNWDDLTGHNDKESIKEAFEDLDKAAATDPTDERIESLRGAILLRLRRLDDAESAYRKALELPTNNSEDRAGILYDLACISSHRKNSAGCHKALQESAKLRPLSKSHMLNDKDLEFVRNEPWFGELIEGSA
jgi:tetratricopeptide (TPR) repeat protein